MKRILITGVAGFIGFHLARRLLDDNIIVGIDDLNSYYDVDLKNSRLSLLNDNFTFIKGSISDKFFLDKVFSDYDFDLVINLAAQAGVRYSIDNPDVYIESNIIGFYNILECMRAFGVKDLVYASSSSVYGNNGIPFSEDSDTDHPISLYAATKKSNELIAYTYSKLYNMNCTGLRFFTVYGPYGRPDMAYFSFTKKILNKETIKLYNYGESLRDFTYIDDIVGGIVKVIDKPVTKIYNIGNGNPIKLIDFVNVLKSVLIDNNMISDYELKLELVEKQLGDVDSTYADNDFNYKPCTSLYDGLDRFIKWYKEYYKV